MAKSKKGRSRKKGITLAPVLGAGIGIWNGWKLYQSRRLAGDGPGDAIMFAAALPKGADGKYYFDKGLAYTTYGPPAVGMIVHEVAGKSTGAFGTGVGLKLNKYTPRGLNI